MPKTLKSNNWLQNLTLALGLLIISGLSYGILANKMGYFLDDWYIVSTYRIFGISGFIEYFRGDRPLLSYVYLVFMPLFRDSIMAWQVFAIFSKWLSALVFWILLKMLLPNNKLFTYATAMLFGIYPGFKFHYFVIMYSQTYFLMAVYFASYIFMLLSFRQGKSHLVFISLALICQFIGIAPMEYFYGLELIRPILIFLVLSSIGQSFGKRASKALKTWLPYGFVFLAFTAFRVLSSRLFSYKFNLLKDLQSNPLGTLLQLGLILLRGVVDSCIKVWISFAELLNTAEGLRATILRTGLVAVAFLLTYLLFSLARKGKTSPETRTSGWLVCFGLACVLAAIVPFVIAGFGVSLDFPNNRFMLPLSVGACIFVVALVDQLFRTQTQKQVVLALLVGFSVGVNYLTAREYKQSWEKQKDFFAQMTWRMPQIKPGTNLVTTILPFAQYFSGTSLTAPLNLIYAPENHNNPIPYQIVLAATNERTQLPDLVPNKAINSRLRAFIFKGNTSDMLVLHAPEKGCLRVLSPNSDTSVFSDDQYFQLWKELIPLSNPSRIITNASKISLPAQYFGAIDEGTWCYFFEKAELANQDQDWNTTISLYSQAQTLNLEPELKSEYLPFIRAFVENGNIETALNISEVLEDPDQWTRTQLCSYWINQTPQLSSSPLKDRASNLIKTWHCEVPYYE
jgi:hypothetical protein